MGRIQNNKTKRTVNKLVNTAGVLVLVYIVATPAAYAYITHKENKKIINYIKDYDSDKKVFYLKKDLDLLDY